jgi:addiction module HigA family antidote
MPKKNKGMPPVHPGEILREDLMKPLGLTVNGLARDLKVPVSRMSEIVNGRRAINADAALRLSRYFGNTPEFWINLQAAYDLRVTIHSSASRIEREVRPRKAA